VPTISSSLMAMLVTSVISLTFLTMAQFSHWLLSKCSHCSPLRPFVQSGSLTRWQSVQVYHHHPPFHLGGSKRSESGWFSYVSSSLICVQSFLSFWRGPTPQQCSDIHFSQSNGSPGYLLCDPPALL
jgi:hypothetical protein